jgi:PST family polysaccharide transporter
MEPDDPAGPPPSLKRTTIRGAQVAMAGYALSRGMMFGVYIVLARLASPRDFGHFAAASVITGVGAVLVEGGMMSALIRRADRIEEAASTAFFSLLVSGCVLTAGALAVAPLVGDFFRSSQVAALSAALSGVLLVQAITIVPDTLLQKRFSFKRRVAVDPLGSAAFCATSIVACANGAGAWGLVLGTYASMLVELVASWLFAGFTPRRRHASISMWRELSSFARPVFGSNVLAKGSTQVDVVLLGRLYPAAVLGQYKNGFRVAQQPADAFVNTGSYVLLPALVRLANHPLRFAGATRELLDVVSVVMLPASLALLPLGEPIAVLLLGPQWRLAGHVIAALCGMLIARAMISIASEVFKAAGRPRLLVRMQIVSQCTMVAFVGATVVPFGPVGVGVAVSASLLVTAAYALRHAVALTGLPWSDMRRMTRGPALATSLMLLAMLGFSTAARPLALHLLVAWGLIAAEAVIGAVVYVTVLLSIDRSRREDTQALLAMLRTRGFLVRAQTPG